MAWRDNTGDGLRCEIFDLAAMLHYNVSDDAKLFTALDVTRVRSSTTKTAERTVALRIDGHTLTSALRVPCVLRDAPLLGVAPTDFALVVDSLVVVGGGVDSASNAKSSSSLSVVAVRSKFANRSQLIAERLVTSIPTFVLSSSEKITFCCSRMIRSRRTCYILVNCLLMPVIRLNGLFFASIFHSFFLSCLWIAEY